MRDLAQQRELTHGQIDDETPKEVLLEFTVISDRMLQGDEDAACQSQLAPPAQAARARSELKRRSDVPEIDHHQYSGRSEAKPAEGPAGKSNEDQP